jgi:hypothetical protein
MRHPRSFIGALLGIALALPAFAGSHQRNILLLSPSQPARLPAWLPAISGQLPSKYEDYTAGHYWLSGQQYGAYASFATAVGASFSRASTATYANASGVLASAGSGALRFDSPNGVAQGLLLEGAATNVVTNVALNGAAWVNFNSTITGGHASPDGGANAYLNVPTATNARHNWILQPGVTATAAVYTGSVYLQAAGYGFGYLGIASPGATTAYSIIVDLTTGAITQTNTIGSPTGTASAATLIGNGWVRLQVSMTATTGTTGTQILFGASNSGTPGSLNSNANEPQFAGDGTSGVAAFWPQLELGPFATSPIPTSGSAATRAADALTNPWTVPSAFTKLVKLVTPPGKAASANMFSWVLDDGTSANRIVLFYNIANGHLSVSISSGATLDLGAVAANTVSTVALAAQSGSYRASLNGAAIVSSASGALPSGITTERYGEGSGGTSPFFGHAEKSIFWPVFAGDTDLKNLAATQ